LIEESERRARALVGDADGAFTKLQRACPRFNRRLERARSDVAAQRERARQRGLLDIAPLLGRPLG
jgi:hypothetical protein